MKTAFRCGAAVLLLAAAAAASAQSLGEIARKEGERRKAIAAPAKVYTNDNLRAEPSTPFAAGAPVTPAAPAVAAAAPAAVPPTPSGVQPAPSGTPPAGATPPATEEVKKDEAYWKQRLEAERSALARAQIFADALQSRINGLTTDFAARSDPAQRDVISMDRQKALAELDRVKQEIQQHQKALADIQEEGRRAGVPPGWLR